MSKAKQSTAKKLKFEKKKIRSLAASDLKDANGGQPTHSLGVSTISMCGTGYRCCMNHNQALRVR